VQRASVATTQSVSRSLDNGDDEIIKHLYPVGPQSDFSGIGEARVANLVEDIAVAPNGWE
jgi:hypothetical protein